MTVMNMVQALNSAIDHELKEDENVLVIGEDVGRDGGVFRVTDGLFEKYGRDRLIDSPLSESGIIATSFGMAVYGMKPIAEIQFSGFIYSGIEHMISHLARIRNRSRGRFTCPMVIRAPYSGGIRALEHHSESMESLYAHTPGLKVVIPSNPYDAKGLLAGAVQDPDPVVFLEPKRSYRAIKEEVPDDRYTEQIDKAKVIQEGQDVTVISYGSMMLETKEAIGKLVDEASIELIDLRSISPLDEDTITKSVEKTGRAVIVQESPKTLGIASEVISVINDKVFTSLEAPIGRVTGFDTVMPLYRMENYYIPDEYRIMDGIRKVINF